MSARFPRIAGVALLGALLSAAIAAAAPTAESTAAPPDPAFRINLKARAFTPVRGVESDAIRRLRAGGAQDRVHFLLQLERLPTAAARSRLASDGVRLVTYVSGRTYVASAKVDTLERLDRLNAFRWAGPLRTDYKLGPEVVDSDLEPWARLGAGRLAIAVQGHEDVDIDVVENLVRSGGGTVLDSVPSIRLVTAALTPTAAMQLARQDAIQYVDVAPPALGEHNDGARPAGNVTPLAAAPYNLNGAGVTVLVYDSGIVLNTHPDFGARVIELDGDAGETTRNHSTHVAGTVGGNGANSNGNDSAGNPNNGTANQWAGMAPAVNIRSFGSNGSTDVLYNSPGDLNANFTTALGNGVDLATMSLGNNVVPNGFPCGQLGDYTGTAILIDQIVRGSIGGQQLIYFESAGNERRAMGGCGTQFSTISSPATAKNSIVVGAINSNDNSMTGFSSWGPTDDGRLRPDIVGPGCQNNGDNGITSTGFIDTDGDGNLDAGETTNSYPVMCGTSMSTPAAAGAMALLVQRWQALNGAGTRPLGHTAKALFIHTATDLGNAGPDYSFGWGQFNAQAAVDLVNADATANLLNVDQVATGATDFYTFNSDGSSAPRVTLVWSDPPAAQLAANTLINNLDLRIQAPDGTTVQPLILNAGSPGNNAAPGNDTINNVEVTVGAAQAGTWEVSVAGTAVPTAGPQQYTVITPNDAKFDNRRPIANAGGPYAGVEGINVPVSAASSSDPDGDSLTYAWDLDNDGAFDDATGVAASFEGVGQDGTYTIRVRATDPDGAFSVASTTVGVANLPPTSPVLATNSPKPELTAVTLGGSFSDPGWLEALTATVNWGDGTPVQVITAPPATLDNIRPNAEFSFTATHTYGDNGSFTVTVCGVDDDTSTCSMTGVSISNVNPTATIDQSGAVIINGQPVLLGQSGVPSSFSGRSMDPGSDDLALTWNWADGTPLDTVNYLVNPPGTDPFPSPSIQPRDVTDPRMHTFGDACFYEIGYFATDDDGGLSPTDTANVIIVGNAAGPMKGPDWRQELRGPKHQYTTAQVLCFLAIVGFVSDVFDEERDASTIPAALAVLEHRSPPDESQQRHLDEELLSAWLNFAAGGVGLTQLVDTDGNGTLDTPFQSVIVAAEVVRNDPNATEDEFHDQRMLLKRINHGKAL